MTNEMTKTNQMSDETKALRQEFSDRALASLLERAPSVAVPADFASRVRSALPAPSAPRRAVRLGRVVAIACMLLIAAALFVLAPHTPASAASFRFWMEMVLLVELGGIAYWLGVARDRAE